MSGLDLVENKKYRAIIFDWDGTAVPYRTAPVDDVLPLMVSLLEAGVILVIISGTTYEKIAKGKLHRMIDAPLLDNLYLGLGRGAYNYGFERGEPVILHDELANLETSLSLHSIAFEFHKILLRDYGIPTDIVFTRPNYCKIDLLVDHDRGEKMHLNDGEIVQVSHLLSERGYGGGLRGLVCHIEKLGFSMGCEVKATTDAKFLEVGLSTKADNSDFFFDKVVGANGISPADCSFWGDEFGYLADDVKGSDALTITEKTKDADFYDVSDSSLELPPNVVRTGGGVQLFLEFLRRQIDKEGAPRRQ